MSTWLKVKNINHTAGAYSSHKPCLSDDNNTSSSVNNSLCGNKEHAIFLLRIRYIIAWSTIS